MGVTKRDLQQLLLCKTASSSAGYATLCAQRGE
jgi:hypothetical protein